jgi:nucleotide-binding universal stress UspA family protein
MDLRRRRHRRSRAHRDPRVAGGYRRVLVAVADNPESGKALDVACRLAADHGASIVAVTAIEVPALLPLDAHMAAEEARSHQLMERAVAVGASYGVAVAPRVRRAREAGAAIVDEIEAAGVEFAVLGAPRRLHARSGPARLGRTVAQVLTGAPCRVLVISATPPAESLSAFG